MSYTPEGAAENMNEWMEMHLENLLSEECHLLGCVAV
jgi:predicted RNase H-like HicB family nuclease